MLSLTNSGYVGRLPTRQIPSLPTCPAIAVSLSRENEDAAELHQAELVMQFVVMAGNQTSEILQPGKPSFDLPPVGTREGAVDEAFPDINLASTSQVDIVC